jgi:hypothetical protein
MIVTTVMITIAVITTAVAATDTVIAMDAAGTANLSELPSTS